MIAVRRLIFLYSFYILLFIVQCFNTLVSSNVDVGWILLLWVGATSVLNKRADSSIHINTLQIHTDETSTKSPRIPIEQHIRPIRTSYKNSLDAELDFSTNDQNSPSAPNREACQHFAVANRD